MDPHEKVNMDAEKIMSGSWDFGFMVKKTLKKLARTAKFHITPLGSLIATIYKPRKSLKGLKGPPGPKLVDGLRHEVSGPWDPGYIYIYIYIY